MRRYVLITAICAGVLWGGPAGADDADMAVFDRAWGGPQTGRLRRSLGRF